MGVAMIDDDQDDVVELDTDLYADPIAARTAAYTSLFRAVMQSEGDMREEGMRMLSRVRCSFKAPLASCRPYPAVNRDALCRGLHLHNRDTLRCPPCARAAGVPCAARDHRLRRPRHLDVGSIASRSFT